MAKFCTKCGAPLNDNAAFCTNCGAPIESKNSGSAAANAADAVMNTFNNVKDKISTDSIKETFSSENIKNIKDNPTKKTLILLGCVVIAAILIIVILISAIFGGGYKSAVDNMFEGIEDANARKYMKALPECQIDYLEDFIEDYDEYTSMKEYFEDYLENTLYDLEDEYGENIKLSYEIDSKEKLSNKELKNIRKQLRSLYDEDDVDVTKGYELEITSEIKGDNKKDKDEITLKVAKVDGDWCVVDGEFLNLLF